MDAEGAKPLTGAKFRLDQYDEGYREVIKSWDETEVSTEQGKEGTLVFEELGAGYYKLVEITPPKGYVVINEEPVFFEVKRGEIAGTDGTINGVTYHAATSGDGASQAQPATFTIPNTSGTPLPHTGGPGVVPFAAIGSVLITIATVLIVRKRRHA